MMDNPALAAPSLDRSSEGSTGRCCILALYEFVTERLPPSEVVHLKEEVEAFLRTFFCRGMILLASEGVNGTICFPLESEEEVIIAPSANDAVADHANAGIRQQHPVLRFLRERFPRLRIRLAYSSENVFHRLRVRIKSEIVTMGVNNIDPVQEVGQYISPGPDWDALLEDPTCWVIDTRNDYEVKMGTFQRAVNPRTQSFVEFPAWLQAQLQGWPSEQPPPSKIAMFCTGGIRCEKATSLCLQMLRDQYPNDHPDHSSAPPIPVYHLEGGILAYLDQVPEEKSKFVGECYVFDQRTAVVHGLQPTQQYTACHACRQPLSFRDRQQESYQEGIACPYCCQDEDRVARRDRYVERHYQIQRGQQRQQQHGPVWPHLHDAKEQQSLLGSGMQLPPPWKHHQWPDEPPR